MAQYPSRPFGRPGVAQRPPVKPFPGRRPNSYQPFAPLVAQLPLAPAHDAIGLRHVTLGIYALMLTVPIAEILIVYAHIHIPVVVIAQMALTVFLITSGHIGRFWQTPMAKPWIAALAMYSVAAVAGIYKGASVPFIAQYGIRFHLVPFYCCALALTARQVRHALRWIGWGVLLLVVLCAMFGGYGDGRFLLPDTSLSNPNDLSFAFLFAMPCLMLNSSKLSRLVAWATCPMVVLYVLKTGSRGSFVTMLAIAAVLFILSSRRVKLTLLVVVPVAAAVMVWVLPAFTLQRLLLITGDTESAETDVQLRNAIGSQEARGELQKRAINLALRNPLFGVGALQFENGVEEMIEAETGQKSGWQGAHNTYLEIGAENGILAMILYAWTLFLCAKLNYRTYRTCRGDPLLAHALTQSLVMVLMTFAFVVCVAFSNSAYDPRVGFLVGLSAANYLAVKGELRPQTAATAVPGLSGNSRARLATL